MNKAQNKEDGKILRKAYSGSTWECAKMIIKSDQRWQILNAKHL